MCVLVFKVIENGKEISSNQVADSESPVIASK